MNKLIIEIILFLVIVYGGIFLAGVYNNIYFTITVFILIIISGYIFYDIIIKETNLR